MTDTTQAAGPQVPQAIISAIQAYGDARADFEAGGKVDTASPFGEAIKLIRAALAAQAVPAESQTAPVEAKVERCLVITLCGSARFERLFKAWNEALTMCGHTVFSLTAYPSDKGRKDWYSDEVKRELDAAHFRKIEASDAIFVINRHAYIGESTMREIEHARSLGKAVYFLESWGKGFGVGSSHTDECQSSCESFGLGRSTSSPIDTFAHYKNGNRDPFVGRLLGPAGSTRSAAVKLVRDLDGLAAQLAASPAPAEAKEELTDDQVYEAMEAAFSATGEWPEGDGAVVRAWIKHGGAA